MVPRFRVTPPSSRSIGPKGSPVPRGGRKARKRWAASGPPAPATSCSTWLRAITSRSRNGTDASSTSKVRALARNGMLFSSAFWSTRRQNPPSDWCQPRRPWLRRAPPRGPRAGPGGGAGPAPRPVAARAPAAPTLLRVAGRARRLARPARREADRRRTRRPPDIRRSSRHREAGRPPGRTAPPARPASPRSWRGAGAGAAAAPGGSPPRSAAHTAARAPPRAALPRRASGPRNRSPVPRTRSPAVPGASSGPLFAGVGVVRRRHQHPVERRVMLHRRLHVTVHEPRRAVHVELLEQEREGALQVRRDGGPDVGGKRPDVALEGSDRLLPGLVVELLVGVAGLPLPGRVFVQPGVDPAPEIGRETRVVEDHVLEVGGEVDLARLHPGKVAERARGKGARPVLHRARQAVALPGHPRQRSQRVEVELHLGDGPIRQDHPAMRGARLHRDLADARE